MNNIEKKKIGDIFFAVQPFSFWESEKIKMKLLKKAVPILGEAVGGLKDFSKIEEMEINGSVVANIAEKLFSSLPEDEYEEIIKRILKLTFAEIKQDDKIVSIRLDSNLNFDKVFSQNSILMFKVIAFVAAVNYPDFFGLLGNIGERMKNVVPSLLPGEKAKQD